MKSESKKLHLVKKKDRGLSIQNIKFIVANEQMRKIVKMAKSIASSDSNVLITGETGTGKGMIARLIHQESARDGSLVIVNSAGLKESLLESELFGHRKGAFTGAIKNRRGYLEEADKGTLFLDEIGDMTIEIQGKVLLALGERVFCPLGSAKKIEADFRLISASNKPLEELAERNEFRSDLLYRLKVSHFHVPPLRERPEDIKLMTEYFLEIYSAKAKKRLVKISQEAMSFLLAYDWPGNVRQLDNTINQVVNLSGKNTLEEEDFQLVLSPEDGLKYVEPSNKRVPASELKNKKIYIRTIVEGGHQEETFDLDNATNLVWAVLQLMKKPKLPNLRRFAVATALKKFSGQPGYQKKVAAFLGMQRQEICRYNASFKAGKMFVKKTQWPKWSKERREKSKKKK